MKNKRDSDQMVREYLRELSEALRSAPASVRNDFIGEIKRHIYLNHSEAELADASATSEILDRIGQPSELAQEVLRSTPNTGRRAFDKTVPWLLAVGGFIFVIGWVVGLYGLWTSAVWRTGDKILGSFVWPIFVSSLIWADANRDATVCVTPPPTGSCSGLGLSIGVYVLMLAGIGIFFRLIWVLYRGEASQF